MSAPGAERAALTLVRLHVARTPGISAPYTLDALSSGVNVVHGPNGSGKSSTARAIDAVLWPAQQDRRLVAAARYLHDGTEYEVALDGGHATVRRGGTAALPPMLPAPELRQRYHLSLHDLLAAADGADRFAEEVMRQSRGGVDLAAASRALGYQARPSQPMGIAQDLTRAWRRLRAAQGAHDALQREAGELRELEGRCRGAEEARAAARLLEIATRHAHAVAARGQAAAALALFPPAHAAMRGTEHEELCALAERAASAAAEARGAAEREQRALGEARESLPQGRLDPERLALLHERAAALRETEREVESTSRRLSDARAQLEAARRTIGEQLTDAQLAAVDAPAMQELASFARDADRLHGERAAAEAELRLAEEGGAAFAAPALEEAAAGARALARWLSAPDASGAGRVLARSVVLALAVLAVLGWAGLALVVHPAAAAGAAIALLLLGLALRGGTAAPSARGQHEREFATLGLAAPPVWERAAVEAALSQLQARIGELRVRERQAQWAAAARARRATLDERWRSLEMRRAALAARFGVPAEVDPVALAWLAEQVGRWCEAWRLACGAEEAAAVARGALQDARAACGECADACGVDAPHDGPQALALAAALLERQRVHDAAVARAGDARAARAAAAARVREAEGEAASVAARCGLASGDLDAVRALCERHGEYRQAHEAARDAARAAADAAETLRREPGFAAELLTCAPSELERRQQEAAAAAGEHGALLEAVTRLRTRIDAATRQREIEQALGEVLAQEDRLRAQRGTDLRAMVGDLLVRHVGRLTRDHERPAVFAAASTLFARMTRGRYALAFDDGGEGRPPAVAALDRTTDATVALEELSSATRVQLLVAVRVAFIEAQEHGVKLPLLLDETLATSDDHRAGAMIDAVVALARDGRQIFYFTAQTDEVARWVASLESAGVESRMIDLAAIRRLEPPGAGARTVVASGGAVLPRPITSRPSPDAHTHDGYGEALGVPVLRPGAETAGAAHLWYLVEDVHALDHLLGAGLSTWGELHTLVEHGGLAVLDGHPRVFARARALARAVEVLHTQAAIGCGRPVDREALVASGAVTPRWLDEVAALAAEEGHHAGRLVAALAGQRLKGFQARKVDDLQRYLEEEGYLDPREPVPLPRLRAAMQGAVMADVAEGVLTLAEVDRCLERILRRLAAGAADQTANGTPAAGVQVRRDTSLPAAGVPSATTAAPHA